MWRVRHRVTDLVLIQKVIHRDGSEVVTQQILNELKVLHECNSPEIVRFYGSFLSFGAREVNIVMEYMDAGCLDSVRHRVGRIIEPMLAPICWKVSLDR